MFLLIFIIECNVDLCYINLWLKSQIHTLQISISDGATSVVSEIACNGGIKPIRRKLKWQ